MSDHPPRVANAPHRFVERSDAGGAYAVFAFLWAAGICIHLWNQPSVALASPWRWFTLAAAASVLWRPRSTARLAVLAGAQIAQVGAELPLVADHWLLAALVNAFVLIAWVRVRRRDGSVCPDAMLSELAPPARVVLLVCYSASALAKYNSTFLDPASSCADFLLRTATPWWAGTEHSPVAGLAVVGALAVESSVPLLLAWPRSRRAGVLVGVVFHLLLGYWPDVAVFDFSALLFALFFLFAPAGTTARLSTEWARMRQRGSPLARIAASRSAQAAVLVMATLAGRASLHPGEEQIAGRSRILLFATYGGVVLVMTLATVAGRRTTSAAVPGGATFHIRSTAHLSVIGLAAAIVACQYTGLRTQGTFTMFSNIRTEGGTTNHLFLPRIALFRYQDDLVRIVESSHPRLQRLADEGQLLPWVEFRRNVRAVPEVGVTYERDGRRVSVSRASEDRALVAPLPFLERKTLTFRSVPAGGPPRCIN